MKRGILAVGLLSAAALAIAPIAAFAQAAGGGTPTTQTTVSNTPVAAAGAVTPITTSATAGTSSSLTAANTTRKVLYVSNEAGAGGGNIAVCPSSVSTPGLNVAGCKTLYPGQFWAPCSQAFCPSDAFTIVGSAPSLPVTLEQN